LEPDIPIVFNQFRKPVVQNKPVEQKTVKYLLYGGCFCPPHKGHFEMIKNKYHEYDKIFISLRSKPPPRYGEGEKIGERLDGQELNKINRNPQLKAEHNGKNYKYFTFTNNLAIWNQFAELLDGKDKKIVIIDNDSPEDKNPRIKLLDNLLSIAHKKELPSRFKFDILVGGDKEQTKLDKIIRTIKSYENQLLQKGIIATGGTIQEERQGEELSATNLAKRLIEDENSNFSNFKNYCRDFIPEELCNKGLITTLYAPQDYTFE